MSIISCKIKIYMRFIHYYFNDLRILKVDRKKHPALKQNPSKLSQHSIIAQLYISSLVAAMLRINISLINFFVFKSSNFYHQSIPKSKHMNIYGVVVPSYTLVPFLVFSLSLFNTQFKPISQNRFSNDLRWVQKMQYKITIFGDSAIYIITYKQYRKQMNIEIESKGYFQHINQFTFVKDIGVGSFGKVKLALHCGTKKHYAIKIIQIENNLSHSQLEMLLRQIKVHSKLDHPHIIKLWETLVDGNKIYMIMDYAKNGSLFRFYSKILAEGNRLSLTQIYKLFYQTLQAIKYLHSRDIMHRDIKPQNLLLDEDLNIKLCDFGWSTSQISSTRTTFCGTYEYMAPEMVLQKSYNYKIDIWALGVLLYELIHGKAPFEAENIKIIKQKINKGSYQLNKDCPGLLKDLVTDILQFNPQQRLSIKQIEENEWIKQNYNLNKDSLKASNENEVISNNKDKQVVCNTIHHHKYILRKHKNQRSLGNFDCPTQLKTNNQLVSLLNDSNKLLKKSIQVDLTDHSKLSSPVSSTNATISNNNNNHNNTDITKINENVKNCDVVNEQTFKKHKRHITQPNLQISNKQNSVSTGQKIQLKYLNINFNHVNAHNNSITPTNGNMNNKTKRILENMQKYITDYEDKIKKDRTKQKQQQWQLNETQKQLQAKQRVKTFQQMYKQNSIQKFQTSHTINTNLNICGKPEIQQQQYIFSRHHSIKGSKKQMIYTNNNINNCEKKQQISTKNGKYVAGHTRYHSAFDFKDKENQCKGENLVKQAKQQKQSLNRDKRLKTKRKPVQQDKNNAQTCRSHNEDGCLRLKKQKSKQQLRQQLKDNIQKHNRDKGRWGCNNKQDGNHGNQDKINPKVAYIQSKLCEISNRFEVQKHKHTIRPNEANNKSKFQTSTGKSVGSQVNNISFKTMRANLEIVKD